ncbi:AraC family ligand binding domain-containing protein [Paenibacillus tarimensis]
MNDQVMPKYRIGEDDFSIQYISHFEPGSMPRPHEHTCFELYYLLDGEREHFMNGNVYTVKKGDMMIINPHNPHFTASSDNLQFERIVVHFSKSFIEKGDPTPANLLLNGPSRLIRIPPKDQPEIEQPLLRMLSECEGQLPYYTALVRSLMHELLIRLHRIEQSSLGQESQDNDHPMHSKVSEIALYISSNYNPEARNA